MTEHALGVDAADIAGGVPAMANVLDAITRQRVDVGAAPVPAMADAHLKALALLERLRDFVHHLIPCHVVVLLFCPCLLLLVLWTILL